MLLGISYAAYATALRPPYLLADLLAGLPHLWAWAFGAAALGCFGVAAFPRSLSMRIASLVTVSLAAGSRLFALMLLDFYVASGIAVLPELWLWAVIVTLQLYAWPTLLNNARSTRGNPWR